MYEQSYKEVNQSQLPAVEMLLKMGDDQCKWQYVSAADTLKLRHHDNTRAILTDILIRNLARLDSYEDNNGRTQKFSEVDIAQKVDELEHIKLNGLIETSKEVNAIIMPKIGGSTIKVLINGRYEDKNIRYFDFDHPENNEYQVTVEYDYVDRGVARMDIVCFINGIPLIQIENKRSSVGYQQAISQLLRYQQPTEIPTIYCYLKLLFAMDGVNAVYGTTGTAAKFYTKWKNSKPLAEETIQKIIGTKIDERVYEQILLDFEPALAVDYEPQKLTRGIKPQDKTILGMLAPNTVLNFIKNYVFFDANDEKVARYQQCRAIEKVLDRINEFEETPTGKRRCGGLVWHTQGSGKSLTMVMLVRAIIEDTRIKNPRIIIVTDRIDLDKQILETFQNSKLKREVLQMKSGQMLLNNIRAKNSAVLTTLVHKFKKAASKVSEFRDDDHNIFVLIDEAHRTEYGLAATAMEQIIPNACFIGFTGTPLLKKDKSLKKFGKFIDKYTIDDALDDGVVVPLIYEGRYIPLEQNEKQIDRQIERLTDGLTNKQKNELTISIKKEGIAKVISLLEEVCVDIEKHYIKRFQNTGLKGQIVAPDKYSALVMQRYFERGGRIKTALVISDENGEISDEEDRKQEIVEYLKKQAGNYGDLKKYEDATIASFKHDRVGVELIIVVDKLLTGFDAPCNTVLYTAKVMQDHNLLQAIARVNRIFDNEKYPKTAGYIIDYSKNAKNIKSAIALFGNYDENDVRGALIDIQGKIEELKISHDTLLDHFRGVENSDCAYIEFLENKQIRNEFKNKFNKLFRVWDECMNMRDFPKILGQEKFNCWQKEMKNFIELKKSAQLQYGEEVDFKKYKRELARILDQHVIADEIETLTDEIKIFDPEFNIAINEIGNDRSRAEAIAAQTKRIISEKLKTDRAYYQKFSDRIEEILAEIRQEKIDDALALKKLRIINHEVQNKKDDDLPKEIEKERGADILWRNLQDKICTSNDKYIEIIVGLTNEIRTNAVVDWHCNHETKRQMREKLDDYLYNIRDVVDYNSADGIIDEIMKLAELNHEQFRSYAK